MLREAAEVIAITISPEDSNQEDDLPLRVIQQKEINEVNRVKEHFLDDESSSSALVNPQQQIDVTIGDPEAVVAAADQTFLASQQGPTDDSTAIAGNNVIEDITSITASEEQPSSELEIKTEIIEDAMEIEFEDQCELPKVIEIKQEIHKSMPVDYQCR